ncbi:MAG: hypothetical protein AB7G37_11205 [Solirubrobacteraceae bacterium]
MTTLAHVGGLHAVLYLSPVVLVMGGLWIAGRNLPDEDLSDLDDDELL